MAIRVYLSYSSQTGNRASAEGYYSHNGSLIVLKDSKICENIRFAADIDEAFINKLDKNYILTQKLRFPSATKAARFVCGGAPVNGKNIWQTEDGTPISELSTGSNDTGIISLRPLDEQFKDDDHPLRGIHSLEQIKKKLEALQASLASDESEDDEGEETSEE